MFSLSTLQAQLKEIEADLLRSDNNNVSRLVDQLQPLEESTRLALAGAGYDQKQVDEVRRSASRIKMIIATRLRLDQDFDALCSKTRQEASLLLQDSNSFADISCMQDVSENQHYYHLRKYFLDNLHHPYPLDTYKKALVILTNESASRAPPGHGTFVTIEQLGSWFINTRRRSGWTDIMKNYACNDKKLMQKLVKAKTSSSERALDKVLSKNLDRTLTAADKKKFEDEWSSMITYIKYGVKDKVGDWIQHIVPASKKSSKPSQGRPVTTAAKRSPARKTPTAKPRKPKQRGSKTPSLDSNADNSFLESTPELSMCSTADTSLSSFTNSFSMMHYDPCQNQDDILRSPTLNAKSNRKVRALPKRAQQPIIPKSLYTDASPATATTRAGISVPENAELPSLTHTQVSDQTTSPSTQPLQQYSSYPPFDALGQVPMLPVPVIRRELLSSNSLSAAFG